MGFDWPFGKSKTVKCKDGSTRLVIKNVDDAFPLYLKEVRVAAKATAKAVGEIEGDASGQYEDRISELLFKIDEYNSSSQTQFRAAYAIYQASPCTHLDYLAAQVNEINAREHALRRADAAVKHIVSIISAANGSQAVLEELAFEVGDNLEKAIDFLRIPALTETLVEEMKQIPGNTDAWKS